MSARSPAATLSRRALLAGAAGVAALPAAAVLAAVEPRMTLPVGPFIARALDALVAEGRLGAHEPVAPHLDGVAAFRADDGRPLTVADLDPARHEVDRYLATLLIERLSGGPLAAYLQPQLAGRFGLHDARLLGTSPVVAVDCRSGDGLRWLRWLRS
jgi:hypothetical protein